MLTASLTIALAVIYFYFFRIYLLKRILHWWFVRKISKNGECGNYLLSHNCDCLLFKALFLRINGNICLELEMQQLKEQRKEIVSKAALKLRLVTCNY